MRYKNNIGFCQFYVILVITRGTLKGIRMAGTFPHNVSAASIPFFWDFRLQPLRGIDEKRKGRPDLKIDAHNWEVRYFWPISHESIVIPAFEDEMYHAEA